MQDVSGVPTSPIVITIEPIALKAERGFNGIQWWGTEPKILLDADSLLLYVWDS